VSKLHARHGTLRQFVLTNSCALGWAIGAVLCSSAQAEVWQFVDRNGVVHMGNVAPHAGRAVLWLEGVGGAIPENSPGVVRSALSLPGYETVKPVLEEAARAQALDPALVIAVAAAESAFNADAVSRKGALGLMQVMPATAQRYGVAARSAQEVRQAVMEPKLNAHIGSKYLADLLRMFDGNKELALAAYNAGEGAVLKHGRRIPPYPETQQYVERVLGIYRSLLR
jgi:soluble lytic murein transglycosylase-like protein